MVKIGAEFWNTGNLIFSYNAPGVAEFLGENTIGKKALGWEGTGYVPAGPPLRGAE